MMKILLLVLVFAAAAGAGVYLLDDSGYVLINIGDYIIETSVVTLVVVAVFGGLLPVSYTHLTLPTILLV